MEVERFRNTEPAVVENNVFVVVVVLASSQTMDDSPLPAIALHAPVAAVTDRFGGVHFFRKPWQHVVE